ncbi:hypothetical protein FNU76_22970 [Chitinimonas arctica]|uniref:ABC-type transport auxiliary lipoprotein component domain-containing protein n=1 Tax=Chitinimonas arctica TaxID=2594795 RepID=A0A516SLF1_9NEIS|nr:hypothetical protein [Chitinimonas arctica]QDQ28976.1 hypothetical protein FNU76_22970 [Chitinimonas arctica]
MRNTLTLAAILLLAGNLSGCAIQHRIADNYVSFLQTHPSSNPLPKTNAVVAYDLTESTRNHHYEFRSVLVGYAHVWIVEIAKMLDDTLASKDVQQAFGKLTRSADLKNADIAVKFDLKRYEFTDYSAQMTMNITATRAGREIVNRDYIGVGTPQGAKFALGPILTGPLLVREAFQLSTQSALDTILAAFVADLQKVPG